MARLVKHDRTRPYKVKRDELEKDTVFICACGLSKDKPFCDSSHRRVKDEEPGTLYVYDDEERIDMPTNYPMQGEDE